MANRLVISSSAAEDIVFPLIVDEVLIGRLDSVDLVIDETGVSRVHAKVVRSFMEARVRNSLGASVLLLTAVHSFCWTHAPSVVVPWPQII